MTIAQLNETLLTVEQAAERCQIPPREIKSAIGAGRLAHARLGSRGQLLRIHPGDLEDWRQRNTVRVTGTGI